MAYFILDDCINCGSCASICPQRAIISGDGQYEIRGACIDCGECANNCPVEAIIPGMQH